MTDTRASWGILATHLLVGHSNPVEAIVELESLGLRRLWLPHLLGLDPLPIFAAAAGRTTSIEFGTAVVPTWPRHPLLLMQEAFSVQTISQGRLTLGVGVSDVATIDGVLGIEWRDPIGHLSEYLQVCDQARNAQVNFDGAYYQVHADLWDVPRYRLPIVASGLNPRAIAVAADFADGLVTLLAPASYLARTVGPRISEQVEAGGFRLIACVPVAVTNQSEAAIKSAEDLYGPFWGYTGYASMLKAAGASAVTDVAAIGDESAVQKVLHRYIDAGVDEVVGAPFPVPGDPKVQERTMRHFASLSTE